MSRDLKLLNFWFELFFLMWSFLRLNFSPIGEFQISCNDMKPLGLGSSTFWFAFLL